MFQAEVLSLTGMVYAALHSGFLAVASPVSARRCIPLTDDVTTCMLPPLNLNGHVLIKDSFLKPSCFDNAISDSIQMETT
jgi:hypothetical protein